MPRPPATACRSWLIALLALLPAVSARAELPAALARQLAELGVPSDAVGLVVAPVAPGPRFLAHQAERPLQPGSTMKLVTTLVGLEQLGPAWRGHTRLLAGGPVIGGVLHGDLILQGHGDMDLDPAALRALLQRAPPPLLAAALAVGIGFRLGPFFPMPVEIQPIDGVVLFAAAVMVGVLPSLAALRRVLKVDPALAFGS